MITKIKTGAAVILAALALFVAVQPAEALLMSLQARPASGPIGTDGQVQGYILDGNATDPWELWMDRNRDGQITSADAPAIDTGVGDSGPTPTSITFPGPAGNILFRRIHIPSGTTINASFWAFDCSQIVVSNFAVDKSSYESLPTECSEVVVTFDAHYASNGSKVTTSGGLVQLYHTDPLSGTWMTMNGGTQLLWPDESSAETGIISLAEYDPAIGKFIARLPLPPRIEGGIVGNFSAMMFPSHLTDQYTYLGSEFWPTGQMGPPAYQRADFVVTRSGFDPAWDQINEAADALESRLDAIESMLGITGEEITYPQEPNLTSGIDPNYLIPGKVTIANLTANRTSYKAYDEIVVSFEAFLPDGSEVTSATFAQSTFFLVGPAKAFGWARWSNVASKLTNLLTKNQKAYYDPALGRFVVKWIVNMWAPAAGPPSPGGTYQFTIVANKITAGEYTGPSVAQAIQFDIDMSPTNLSEQITELVANLETSDPNAAVERTITLLDKPAAAYVTYPTATGNINISNMAASKEVYESYETVTVTFDAKYPNGTPVVDGHAQVIVYCLDISGYHHTWTASLIPDMTLYASYDATLGKYAVRWTPNSYFAGYAGRWDYIMPTAQYRVQIAANAFSDNAGTYGPSTAANVDFCVRQANEFMIVRDLKTIDVMLDRLENYVGIGGYAKASNGGFLFAFNPLRMKFEPVKVDSFISSSQSFAATLQTVQFKWAAVGNAPEYHYPMGLYTTPTGGYYLITTVPGTEVMIPLLLKHTYGNVTPNKLQSANIQVLAGGVPVGRYNHSVRL